MPLELLFIVIVLTAAVTLGAAVVKAFRGRVRQSIWLATLVCVSLAIYLGIVIVVSLVSPQRVVGIGELRCSDEWCIAVIGASRSSVPGGTEYSVAFQLSSRARGVSQRENGVVVYLMGGTGRRHLAEPDPTAVPFDVLLQPGQAVTTSRRFRVLGEEKVLGVVVGREGSNAIPGLFIIGDDGSLFHRPAIVRIP
jgi:hypothetical protein